MSLTAAATGFVVLLTVTVVQGRDGWGVTYTSTQICAVVGSTVDIRCTYTHPPTTSDVVTEVGERFWFTTKDNRAAVDLTTDPDYTGRVEYHFDENNCTLRIKDLRESDSAEYKFRFTTDQPGGRFTGSPGVTLSVADLQVQVRRSSTQTELECLSSCPAADPPSCVWYSNGHKMSEETSSCSVSARDGDSYSCAFKGHEADRSAPVYPPKLPAVSVTPSDEVVKGNSVTLTCSSDANPAAAYTWYKVGGSTPLREDSQLFFSSIQSSDSGEYYCAAKNELGTSTSGFFSVGVTYAPKLPSVSVKPSGDIKEGSSVTLTCSSDANPAAKYIWYNAGSWTPLSEESQLVFRSIQSSDSGEYYCTADNKLGRSSDYISIEVKYCPRLPSVSVKPSGDIKEGSSVTLTCSSDANPAAAYTWYKVGGSTPLREESQLFFSSIQSSDSGEYYCAAKNELGTSTSGFFSVGVKYAPKLPSVSVKPSGDIKEGSSVTLTCSSDANPAAKYIWYNAGGWKPLREESQLVFRSIQSSDSGEYYCAADNKLGVERSKDITIEVKYRPRLPSVSVRPSGDIKEGRSVTLTCSCDANPAAAYTWYKVGGSTPLREESQLFFSSIQSSDSGEYYCVAKNELGTSTSGFFSVGVKYPPRLPSVSVSPSAEVVEGSSVTLTCSSDANPAAKYTWYKENRGNPLSREPQLVFRSIQPSESGQYYCTAWNNIRPSTAASININVNYPPRLPSVSVSPSAEVVEGSSVTLTCSSDANPAAEYTWYKENQPLPQPPGGRYHFTSISSDDRGIYHCKSENQYGQMKSSSVLINVQYAPKLPSVSASPSAEVVEGSSVTLTCSSDANPAANYTWYKEDEESPKASGQMFTITDFRPEHSGNYSCEAQNTRGRHHTTLQLNVVAGTWRVIVGAAVPAILLALILTSAVLWITRKQCSKQLSEPGETPATREQLQPAEDDLAYASVHFSKKQSDLIYSNFTSAQSRRRKGEQEEEEEMTVYAAVVVHSNSTAPRIQTGSQEAAEDPAALYSAVNKLPRKREKPDPSSED